MVRAKDEAAPTATPSRRGRREAQRRRTRKAIVDAAMQLLAEGRSPSVDDIATAADVSRRTVYMYFPTLDHLIVDATAGALATASVEAVVPAPKPGDDPAARAAALARSMSGATGRATLPLGRRLIRLTVDAPGWAPQRGLRRIEWIERAIEPIRGQLSREQFERLVSALALVIGWEAQIVLQDIRQLGSKQEARVTAWAAHALVEAMQREASQSSARRGNGARMRSVGHGRRRDS